MRSLRVGGGEHAFPGPYPPMKLAPKKDPGMGPELIVLAVIGLLVTLFALVASR